MANNDQDNNRHAEKYKTTEERQAVFKLFCDHISGGLSIKSFVECDYRTMNKMIEDYPEELDKDLLRRAKAECRKFWEEMGIDGTKGTLKGYSSDSWKFNMTNRYKDDWKHKVELGTDPDSPPVIQVVNVKFKGVTPEDKG